MTELPQIIDILDKITIVFTFVTMLMVGWNRFKNQKGEDKIQIYFQKQTGSNILLKNISIIRKHITRSEVLGILGVLQINSKERYNINYLSSETFFDDLFKIQIGKMDKLVIRVTDEELKQFIIPENTLQ